MLNPPLTLGACWIAECNLGVSLAICQYSLERLTTHSNSSGKQFPLSTAETYPSPPLLPAEPHHPSILHLGRITLGTPSFCLFNLLCVSSGCAFLDTDPALPAARRQGSFDVGVTGLICEICTRCVDCWFSYEEPSSVSKPEDKSRSGVRVPSFSPTTNFRPLLAVVIAQPPLSSLLVLSPTCLSLSEAGAKTTTSKAVRASFTKRKATKNTTTLRPGLYIRRLHQR